MDLVKFNEDYRKGRVFLFFQGEDCGLCQGMKRKSLEELRDFPGKFMVVDLSERPDLRGKFQVFSFPTLLYLKDGKELGRLAGFFDFESFKRTLKS